MLSIYSQSLARPLTITLVRANQFGLCFDIASYVLDSIDDCDARRGFFLFYGDSHTGVLIDPSVLISYRAIPPES